MIARNPILPASTYILIEKTKSCELMCICLEHFGEKQRLWFLFFQFWRGDTPCPHLDEFKLEKHRGIVVRSLNKNTEKNVIYKVL